MGNINNLLDLLKEVVVTTLGHLVWLLGLIFLFGIVLYFLAKFTRLSYVKSAGYKLDVVFTGWIGTPVHELGHALFCLVFGHKINEMKLYNPDPSDGTLGYVNHSYNPESRFQKIGNFFIGIGPILFGAFVLYALFYYLLPDLQGVFGRVELQGKTVAQGIKTGSWTGVYNSMADTTSYIVKNVFSSANFSNWKFWVFLYLSMCVASHMELSPPDIKGAQSGLVSLVAALLFFNLIILVAEAYGLNSYAGSYWSYFKLETYAVHINSVLGMLGGLFVLAAIISGINFIISFIALSVYSLVKGRGLFNPFWV